MLRRRVQDRGLQVSYYRPGYPDSLAKDDKYVFTPEQIGAPRDFLLYPQYANGTTFIYPVSRRTLCSTVPLSLTQIPLQRGAWALGPTRPHSLGSTAVLRPKILMAVGGTACAAGTCPAALQRLGLVGTQHSRARTLPPTACGCAIP